MLRSQGGLSDANNSSGYSVLWLIILLSDFGRQSMYHSIVHLLRMLVCQFKVHTILRSAWCDHAKLADYHTPKETGSRLDERLVASHSKATSFDIGHDIDLSVSVVMELLADTQRQHSW